MRVTEKMESALEVEVGFEFGFFLKPEGVWVWVRGHNVASWASREALRVAFRNQIGLPLVVAEMAEMVEIVEDLRTSG